MKNGDELNLESFFTVKFRGGPSDGKLMTLPKKTTSHIILTCVPTHGKYINEEHFYELDKNEIIMVWKNKRQKKLED